MKRIIVLIGLFVCLTQVFSQSKVVDLYEVAQGNVALTTITSLPSPLAREGLWVRGRIANQYLYTPYGIQKNLNHPVYINSPRPRAGGAVWESAPYRNLLNQTHKPFNITSNQFGYTGQSADSSTGLMMLGYFRNYAPGIGRFIQPDTYNSFSKHSITNPLAYVNNNPISFVDSTGHFVGALLLNAIATYLAPEMEGVDLATELVADSELNYWADMTDDDMETLLRPPRSGRFAELRVDSDSDAEAPTDAVQFNWDNEDASPRAKRILESAPQKVWTREEIMARRQYAQLKKSKNIIIEIRGLLDDPMPVISEGSGPEGDRLFFARKGISDESDWAQLSGQIRKQQNQLKSDLNKVLARKGENSNIKANIETLGRDMDTFEAGFTKRSTINGYQFARKEFAEAYQKQMQSWRSFKTTVQCDEIV